VKALITQGITTAVINPDGGGPADLLPQFKTHHAARPGVNVVRSSGHNTARIAAMGYDERDPKAEELEKMRQVIRAGMQAGAWGISDGLFLCAGESTRDREVIELAKIVRAVSRASTPAHVRDDGTTTSGAVGAVAKSSASRASGAARRGHALRRWGRARKVFPRR